MLSVVACMVAILLCSVDGVLSAENGENALEDQIADESYSKEYHAGVNSFLPINVANKYGDIITKNYSNIYSNKSANTHLSNIRIENNHKLFLNHTNTTTPLTYNRTTLKQNKFVFPKLNPLPDLTGWITVIPLEPTEEGGRKRHGLFRIGRFQNGQYYLNPIRRPGQDLNSSGGLTPLTIPFIRKHMKSFRTNHFNKKVLHKKMNSGFSTDPYQDTNALPLEPVYPEDSIATESRPEKIVINTKIKHHHHHHHHKYLKTVLKKVPVHVPVKVFVDKPYVVEKKVPYPVEKVVHKVIHKKVPIFIEKHIKVPYPVKVKVPEPYPVKVVHKEYVAEPYPVIKKVPVYKEVKVPVHHYIHHTVEKRVPYAVKVPVEVKVPFPVEVEKKILYPVKVFVPKPYPVEQVVQQPIPVPVYVDKPVIEEDNMIQHPYQKVSVEQSIFPSSPSAPAQSYLASSPSAPAPSYPINVFDLVPHDINQRLLQRKSSSGGPSTLTPNKQTSTVKNK